MADYGTIEKDDKEEAKEAADESSPLIESKKHPLQGVDFKSIWSVLVFSWMRSLLELGNEQQKLDPDDLGLLPLPENCSTKDVTAKFEKYWKLELDRADNQRQKNPAGKPMLKAPSLSWALFRAFGADFLRAGVLKLVHDLCIFVGPLVLYSLIYFIGNPNESILFGFLLTLALLVAQLTMSFCLRHYFFKCYLTGLRLRTAVVVAVYQKALVLSSAERHSRSIGEITNLMSIDALRMQDLTTYLHAIWYSFLQISLAIIFLWRLLGPSCLGGVAVILIMIPVTKSVAEWMGELQKKLMQSKDARVEVNTEVFAGMKIIKLQAWEESFQDKLTGLRSVELNRLGRYLLAEGASFVMWSSTPAMVAVATFAAYVLSGNQLHVATALTSLALFDILRFPLFMLPRGRMIPLTPAIVQRLTSCL